MLELTTKSEAETRSLAAALAGALGEGDIVALQGALGAGKTCFVRGLAEGLAVEPSVVSSPTFITCQEYPAGDGRTLVHIDAYRMSGVEDLETIGWEELLDSPGVIIAIEWPERIASALPGSVLRIALEHAGADARRITIEASHAVEAALREAGHGRGEAGARPCPICGQAIAASAETWPFCSERCRLVDLGQWLGGRYTVSRSMAPEDID